MPVPLLLRCLALLVAFPVAAAGEEAIRIGSKRFTESYLLGEIAAQAAREAGAPAEHRQGLGNTAILVEALRSGAIDAYPEYSGTIVREILRLDAGLGERELNAELARQGLAASVAFGFQNTYALAMRGEAADRLGIANVSDLARRPGLRIGLSHEFLGRQDGWPGLARAYALDFQPVALDHGLAYDALSAGRVDVVDAYTTDARIARDGLRLLTDDRGYFPRYDAMLLYRADVPTRHPVAWQAIAALAGRIDGARMAALNGSVELDRREVTDVARGFLSGTGATGARRSFATLLFGADFPRLLAQHAALVFASLVAAIAVGVPLGIVAARWRRGAQPLLAGVGLLQTVPALALLAILIPVTGRIGIVPATLALFLYALLPIVRNTHAGLQGVRVGVVDAGRALGLGPAQVLALVELPLAMPTIVAGIKTAAVISVGTATIAAFIGAGGFGERIVQGLALSDDALLLAGALPAAALALAMHFAFEWIERRLAPR